MFLANSYGKPNKMPVAADAETTGKGVADMADWKELEAACRDCTGCGLCKTRQNVVFGVGNKTADILFVGEGPGQQEDRLQIQQK